MNEDFEEPVPQCLLDASGDPAVHAALSGIFRRNRHETDGDPEQLARSVLEQLCLPDTSLLADVGGLRFTVEVFPAHPGCIIHASVWDEDVWREVDELPLRMDE